MPLLFLYEPSHLHHLSKHSSRVLIKKYKSDKIQNVNKYILK